MKIRKPTKVEVEEFVKAVDAACFFQAIHGVGDKPIPAVVRTMSWVEQQFGLYNNRMRCLKKTAK